MPTIVAHRADPDLGSLPEVIISHFGDGHIELMSYPIDHLPDHMALSLQRMIFRNSKIQLTNPHDHIPHSALTFSLRSLKNSIPFAFKPTDIPILAGDAPLPSHKTQ